MVPVKERHGLMNQLVEAFQVHAGDEPAALEHQVVLIPVVAKGHQHGNAAESQDAKDHLPGLTGGISITGIRDAAWSNMDRKNDMAAICATFL